MDRFQSRLEELRRTGKLSLSYMELTELPRDFVEKVLDSNPRIAELDLRSNRLQILPDDLDMLSFLTVLRLNYNNFSVFPPVLSALPRLHTLEMSGNKIGPDLPPALTTMSHVKEVDLSGNKIVKISGEVQKMQSLVRLNLENNGLEIVPENIGDLPSLQNFDASGNKLQSIPDSFGRMKKLTRLDLSGNLLTSLPPSLGHLKQLRELDVRFNPLPEPMKSKSTGGVPHFLEFLREEEHRQHLQQIERLKPQAEVVGRYRKYRIKSGAKLCPGFRAHCSVTPCALKTVVFGGAFPDSEVLGDNRGKKSGELWVIDSDFMNWKLVEAAGDEKPAPRLGHACAFDALRNVLYLFGGRNDGNKKLNDLYSLNVDTWEWKRRRGEGDIPTPRENPSVCMLNNQLVVFGGKGTAPMNDLYVFDPDKNMWTSPSVSGSIPAPRDGCALAVDEQRMKIYAFGGKANFAQNDLYVLDFFTMQWELIKVEGQPPPPRSLHRMCLRPTLNSDGSIGVGELFVFGGMDEFNSQDYNLFRYSIKNYRWDKLDSELDYSESRIGTFTGDADALHLFETRDIEIEGRGRVWDVYKIGENASWQLKREDRGDRPPNAKLARINNVIRAQKEKMPYSFTHCSPKEVRVIEYCSSYLKIFRELYPWRRVQLLVPRNECDMSKFICTTIRPSYVQHLELYDLHTLCRTFGNLVTYEELDDPLAFSDYVPSPWSVLKWQAGDCIDLSITLTSLLIGAGFDAYVITGYAPRWVTTCNQTMIECPVLEEERLASMPSRTGSRGPSAYARDADSVGQGGKSWDVKISRSAENNDGTTDTNERGEPYHVSDPSALASKYVAAMRERSEAPAKMRMGEAELEALMRASLALTPADPIPNADVDDPLDGTRVHAWVLVKAGKREVSSSVFIEPCTGRIYSPEHSPYQAVESVFNHKNYWINMQGIGGREPAPARRPVSSLGLDLTDSEAWEVVFDDVHEPDVQSNEDVMFFPRMRKVAQWLNRREPPEGKDGAGQLNPGDDDAHELFVASWVPALNIVRESLDSVCPRGYKLVKYFKSHLEAFALYGEAARWDGMVGRLSIFNDTEYLVLSEVREEYRLRRDKLRRRILYDLENKIVEMFDPGRSHAVKDIVIIKDRMRTTSYYSHARLDGLISREEDFGMRMVERFEGRADRLVYRSTRYGPPPSPMEPNDADLSSTSVKLRNKKKQEDVQLPIVKVTEKFSRDESVPATRDIAKRTFYVLDGNIKIAFHYDKHYITAGERIYARGGAFHEKIVDVNAPTYSDQMYLEEYQDLLQREREIQIEIRDVEHEMRELVRVRAKEEQNILLEVPYFDAHRTSDDTQEDTFADEEQQNAHDYLTPYLPRIVGQRALSRTEALQTRDLCLKALKERLVERANIIQGRHDEETAALAKRQQNFQRDRDQVGRAEEEEYERACEESMFRIHILEQRLIRHEEQALQRYYELDMKLRADTRLSALNSTSA